MSGAFGTFGPPVLFVEDLKRSVTFYVDELGFTHGFGDATSAGLFLGDEMFLLVTVPSAEEMLPGSELASLRGQRPAGLFNIFVEDVDATFADLKSKGITFIVDPMDREWGRRTAHFQDPDGVIWEISQSIE